MKPRSLAAWFLAFAAAYASAQTNAGDQPSSKNLPFTITQVASLRLPWRIAFLPDGRMLVTEKVGGLVLVTPQGDKTPVANVPAASNSAVAEYVVAAAVVLLRRLCWADSEVRKGNYAPSRAHLVSASLRGLEGLLAGVVGLGTIGLAAAAAFHKMGCRICYYDPAPRDRAAAESWGARQVSLHELLETADVISLHVPLLPETRGMIGERQLAKMKAGAVLVQASRGGVVDEVALAGHLRSGHLGGAAVDVYSSEPPSADNPLLMLAAEGSDRIWLTPHIAGVTRQASEVLFRAAWANVERVLITGQPPLNRVY